MCIAVFLPGNISLASSAADVPLWGQAYSPNIGWINFYCDGAGNSLPSGVTKGSSTIDSCANNGVSYGVTLHTTTNILSGYAYSPNVGWLDMTGVSLTTDKLSGSTTFGNFGTSYFGVGEPNVFMPGVSLGSGESFSGYGYSEEIGYFSFARDNLNAIAWYNNQDYGVYTDMTPPTLATGTFIFEANAAKEITLSFADSTKIVSASVTVDGAFAAGSSTYTAVLDPSTGAFTFTHDFSESKLYDLTWTACDSLDNCDTQTAINYIQVVAAAPLATSSSITFGSPTKIADGRDPHFVQLNLRDAYGNPVESELGIKDVRVIFSFKNTTKLDQIAGTGDAARYAADSNSFATHFVRDGGTMTDPLIGKPGNGGAYRVYAMSYTPTSAGFAPIASAGFDLNFESVAYEVVDLTTDPVGAAPPTLQTSVDPERIFDFAPMQTADLDALQGDALTVQDEAWDSLTLGNTKRFVLKLANESPFGVGAEQNELGILADTADDNMAWKNTVIEKNHGVVVNEELVVTSSGVGPTSWNDLAGEIASVPAASAKYLRLRSTPSFVGSDGVGTAIDTNLALFLGYQIGTKHVRHLAANVQGAGTTGTTTANASVNVIGSTHATAGTNSHFSNDVGRLSKSIGDLSSAEATAAIKYNVKNFIGNNELIAGCGAASAAGDGKVHITDTNWFQLEDCSYQDNSILFFNGVDVVIEDTSDDIVAVPANIRTILIRDGNLEIKSNIIYPADIASFGVIVMQDTNINSGLVRVYPNVRNIVGAMYADSAVVSVSSSGLPVFLDRGSELANQLYWQGSIFSQNTFGGSNITPPICPAHVNCAALATGIQAIHQSQHNIMLSADEAERAAARAYDFSYLRTYYPSGLGARAGYNIDGSDNPLLPNPPADAEGQAFILKYDTRIKTNPPPLFAHASQINTSETAY